MAEPGTGTAGGPAASSPLPPQTDTAGPGPAETPQNETAAQKADQPQTQPQPPPQETESHDQPQPQTGKEEVAGKPQWPLAPSHDTTAAADAANQPPAQLQQQKQGDGDTAGGAPSAAREDEKVAATTTTKPGRISHWPRLRSSLLSLCRQRLRTKQRGLIEQPTEEDGGKKDKNEDEGSKRRHDEAEALAPPKKQSAETIPTLEEPSTAEPPTDAISSGPSGARLKAKLQKAVRFVSFAMSWYRRHRSSEKEKEKPTQEGPAEKPQDEETKPPTSPQQEEPKSKQDESAEQPSTAEQEKKRRWPKEEARLERILEVECAKLVGAEFAKLSDGKKRRCLLTFSVFALDSQVKKQAVTYWWATEFGLESGKGAGAEDAFSKLADGGFLEPIKNYCSGAVHGCRVNPLVHWMLKQRAKGEFFADLDDRGDPADVQPKSPVLCLTAGNRVRLQKLRKDDETQAQTKQRRKKKSPTEPTEDGAQPQPTTDELVTTLVLEDLEKELAKKKVILNVSAHVYRLPELLLSNHADRLVVLQLGRWWNSDNDTYMEVEALESMRAIGKLKNLRYLSLRGLSQLTELPAELRRLAQLAILDARGCQNLVKVPSATIRKLKWLTHLDLTECYMLEHIGRGVAALPELRVFKGFVFGAGKRRRDACWLQDLARLRKLWKLSLNVTTDANVGENEMAQLGRLVGLRSLTVTWGELPTILQDAEQGDKRLEGLLRRWTSLVLPPKLEKLDVRCYPDPNGELHNEWFKERGSLKKLYVRGGEVKTLNIPSENNIEILRLRFLDHFEMEWVQLLDTFKCIKCVEVWDYDDKVIRSEAKGEKAMEKHKDNAADEQAKRDPIKKRMKIPKCTVDENGVWVKDPKEEYAKQLPASGGVAKNGASTNVDETGKISVPKPSEGAQALGEGSKVDAPKTEATTSATDAPKVPDQGKEGLDDAGKAPKDKQGQGEPTKSAPGHNEAEGDAEEDGGEAAEVPSEVKKVDNSDAGKAQTGEDGQQGDDSKAFNRADEQPTADAKRSAEVQQPDITPHEEAPIAKEDAPGKVLTADASASGMALPSESPATSNLATAATGEADTNLKEQRKADNDGSKVSGTTDTTSSATT